MHAHRRVWSCAPAITFTRRSRPPTGISLIHQPIGGANTFAGPAVDDAAGEGGGEGGGVDCGGIGGDISHRCGCACRSYGKSDEDTRRKTTNRSTTMTGLRLLIIFVASSLVARAATRSSIIAIHSARSTAQSTGRSASMTSMTMMRGALNAKEIAMRIGARTKKRMLQAHVNKNSNGGGGAPSKPPEFGDVLGPGPQRRMEREEEGTGGDSNASGRVLASLASSVTPVFWVFQWGRLVPRADTCALAVTFGVLPTPDQPGWGRIPIKLSYSYLNERKKKMFRTFVFSQHS